MPSKSKSQHNLMALVANNPKAAKRLNIPQSVGEEFMKADKGKKFAKGGMSLFKGKESYGEELKEAKAVKSGKISPKQFVKGEKSEGHKGEEPGALKMAKEIKSGKMSPSQYAAKEAKEEGMKKGGKVKRYVGGGMPKADKEPAESAYDKQVREEAMQAAKDTKMQQQNAKAYEKAREQSLGTPEKKRAGGMCSAKKYVRGGGIEVRGKTKGRFV